MSNRKSDTARKGKPRVVNPNAKVQEDNSGTPIKLTPKDIKPKGQGRPSREYNYKHKLKQEEFEKLPIYAPLSIKQEKYLNDTHNDIIVWGGAASAGKTQLTLLKIMLNAFFDPEYTAGIARRSQRQMKQAGSLWSTGTRMFSQHGVSANKVEMQWTFPSGAEVKCHHLDGNPDDWQGSQLTTACVDEAQQCEESDIWYLTSRLRSKSKQKSQLMLTCNPLNTSFLCDWLMKAGYVGEDGLAVKEMDGVTTYMVQVGGRFEWYKTREEIKKLYGNDIAKYALAFVFYSANVYDNPYIRKYAPEYISKLENLKDTERRRLLLGDWLAKVEGQGYIKKEQFNQIALQDIPLNTVRCRAWDIAGTAPNPVYPNPDWTRGILGTYDRESGNFYIMHMASIRDNHAMVQALIEKCVSEDGKDTYVSIPIDPGAAGRSTAEQKKARLMSMGAKVVLEPTRQSKLVRAEPFLIAVQEGKVFVAPGVFSNDDYREIEAFDGGKNGGMKDDIIDALASCYNNLVSGNLIPTIRLGASAKTMKLGGSTLL